MHDQPNAVDFAWAAGLFEGEGCWNAYWRPGKTTQGMQMRLSMTDRDVVEKFAAIVGCGNIRHLASKGPREKPLTEWCCYRRADIRRLINVFLPHLGERRSARAHEMLALGEARPMNERTHCAKGHPYSGENLMLEPITRDGRHYFARRCRICRLEQMRLAARARRKRANAHQ